MTTKPTSLKPTLHCIIFNWIFLSHRKVSHHKVILWLTLNTIYATPFSTHFLYSQIYHYHFIVTDHKVHVTVVKITNANDLVLA